MLRSKITGVGSYVPNRVIKNQDLTQWMDTSDEWIQQRSGIKERRWIEAGQTNADLAFAASEKALQQAGLHPKDIDLIVLGTLSPDHDFPGPGCFLQHRLGLNDTPALDIRQQCSGFIYGMAVADQFIRTGTYKNVLVVGSEVHSTGLDISTRGRDVSVLFGDGAGAIVLSATDVRDATSESYLYSTHLHADGAGAKELWTPAPGAGVARNGSRFTREMFDEGLHFPHMNGKRVYVAAVTRMGQAISEALTANKLGINDIDLFLFHQANLRINEAVGDALRIAPEKIFNTIQNFGNTTAATIPLGMDEALKAGALKKGMRVALGVFGAGFTWASAVLRY